MKNSLILILFILASYGLYADVFLKEVGDNQSVLSPDKRFTATFNGVIVIQDGSTSETFPPLRVLQPIYLMAWSQDSKNLFFVENIAGGTYLSIFQFTDNKWVKHSIDPPGDNFDSYRVVDLDLSSSPVVVSYVTSSWKNDEKIYERITFCLRLKDIYISKVLRTKITLNEYNDIKTRK